MGFWTGTALDIACVALLHSDRGGTRVHAKYAPTIKEATNGTDHCIERMFGKIDVNTITTNDPDSYHDTTLLISQQPGDTVPHAELSNVPLEKVSLAKPARHSSQPYSSSVSRLSNEPPKRSSTTPSEFSTQTFPRAKFDVGSPVMQSPISPFSSIHMPPSTSTGYNSLPEEEPDHYLPAEPQSADDTAGAASSGDLGSGSTTRYG